MEKNEAFIVVNQEKLRIQRQRRENKMSELTKSELLVWLKCRFCNEETPCDGCIRLKRGCQEKQAYKQIKEIINKRSVK